MKATELKPKKGDNVLVRAVFLYVGQGDSTLLFIKDGDKYKTVLVDVNRDKEHGGIDVCKLLKDIQDGEKLDLFLNTHPHKDHLNGFTEIYDEIGVRNVWHSGFNPGKGENEYFDDFKKKIDSMKKSDSDSVRELRGSRTALDYGDAQIHVLAPAEYVKSDIAEEDKEKRRKLIHENCIVFKVGKGESWIMQPGDADKAAFEKHILPYHKERMSAQVLSAPHHGSRHFFKDSDDDETAWTDALDAINPTDIIISAPTQKESPHGHPHADAVSEYEKKCGKTHVFHTGADRMSFYVDIGLDGSVGPVKTDDGDLSEKYALDKEDDSAKGFKRTEGFAGDVKPAHYA